MPQLHSRVFLNKSSLKTVQPDIQVRVADITKLDFRPGAIVNAANEQLAAGGGVCGAIHKAAGPQLEPTAQQMHGQCPTGQAVATPAFKLNANYIIHAVGPRYLADDPTAPELLASAYQSAIQTADSLKLQSIVFPSISTGIYGYPIAAAAEIAIQAINHALKQTTTLKNVVICCFSNEDAVFYREELQW